MVAASLLCALNLVANGDMESLIGTAVAGWQFDERAFSVQENVGRNGTRGLVWRRDDSDGYFLARGRIAVRPGVAYRFGGWIKPNALAGDKPFGALYFECYDKTGNRLYGTNSRFATKVGEWMRTETLSEKLPAETNYAVLIAYAKRGATGDVVFDDLFVEAQDESFLGEVWTSAYRNAAADGKVKLFAEYNPFAREARIPGLRMTFRIPRGQDKWIEMNTVCREGVAEAEADVSEFRFGNAPIQFLAETNGVYYGSKTIFFERFHGSDPRKVRFDENNHAIVFGKKFFPIGMYMGVMTKRDIDLLAEGGFNCAMPYRVNSLTPDILDHCQQRGIMVIPNIKDSFYGERYCNPKVVDDATGESWVGEQVSRLKDHPAILAWYSCDESELSMVQRLRERQRLLERLDPDHPTWTVLYQARQVRRYLGAFDIVGTDPYPIADLGQHPTATDGIRRASDWTRHAVDGVFGGMRPVWQVPQYFDWGIVKKTETERLASKSRLPTEEEARNMTWQCLVEGANGIVYYAFFALRTMEKRLPFEKSFAVVARIAQELRANERYFLDGDSQQVVTTNAHVISRRWNLGDKSLLAIVNASEIEQSARIEGSNVTLKPYEVLLNEEK